MNHTDTRNAIMARIGFRQWHVEVVCNGEVKHLGQVFEQTEEQARTAAVLKFDLMDIEDFTVRAAV